MTNSAANNRIAITIDEELVERARHLIPALRERSARAIAQRCIPVETIDDFRAAGFFRMLQPRRFGGYEKSYETFALVLETLAQGCGSSAWVLAKLGEHPWYISCFSEDAQNDVWAGHSDALVSASFVPRPVQAVPGGYRVSGSWSFSSGCDHAQWVFLGMLGENGVGFMLVPMADLEIVDDWYSFGLQGTGSKSLRLTDVFVPAHRTISAMEMATGTGPGGRFDPGNYLPRASLVRLAHYGTPSVSVGLAQRALDIVIAATTKEMLPGGIRAAEQQYVQVELAAASAELDMIRALRTERVRGAVEDARNGVASNPLQLTQGSRDMHVFAQRLNLIVLNLCGLSNSRWVLDSDPRQLILRDIIAASAHRAASWDALVPAGREMLGLQPPRP